MSMEMFILYFFPEDICHRLGLDIITAGNLCGLAIEAGHRGKIDLGLDYGDAKGIADLLHLIARQEGVGAILAEGIRFAAKTWDLEEIISKVTGFPANRTTLSKKARAIATVIRKFNLREGMTTRDDRLPPALHSPQADSGMVISERELNTMLKEYYELHGWDADGTPI